MTDLPKRRRGRPSKAEAEARKAAEQRAAEAKKNSPEGQEDAFIEEVLTRPFTGRRSKIELNEDTLRIIYTMAKIGAIQKEIAAALGVSDRTLVTFMNNNPEARDAWEDGQQLMKISLRRKQLALADKNAPAAIFLGKNLLGQKDVIHTNTTVNRTANELSEDELMEILERSKTKVSKGSEKAVH